jgi:threonine 3-dehydrogenase
VDVAPVITHHFALEDFAEAFDVMASGRSGKILLVPNDPKAEDEISG